MTVAEKYGILKLREELAKTSEFYNDKFVLQNKKKRTFILSQIQSISLNQQDYLQNRRNILWILQILMKKVQAMV